MKNDLGWIPSEEGEMGWIDKYCCWFPASEAPGRVPWNTAFPAQKGTCFLATPAQGQWQWNARQRASWPGPLLHCVFLCLQECADLASDNTERALSPAEHQAPSPLGAGSFPSLNDCIGWTFIIHRGRQAGGWREKNRPFSWPRLQQVWAFTPVDLTEFYFFVSFELCSKIPVVIQFLFWKINSADISYLRVLELERNSEMILVESLNVGVSGRAMSSVQVIPSPQVSAVFHAADRLWCH